MLRPAAASAFAAVLASLVLAGCGKPIVVHAITEGSREPIADVRVYRHVFGLFRFFPGKKFVNTGPDGSAEVMVGSANTTLTMLRSGYEPVLFGVFEVPNPSIAPDPGGYEHVIQFRDIKAKPENGYDVAFRPVRREPIRFRATDAETKRPLAGVDAFGATFLYLPQPGVEADWGFPPLQRAQTDGDGSAALEQVSGFRNRFTLRMAGYQDRVLEVDGRAIDGAREVDMPMRALRTKKVDFLVVDAKSGAPLAGAEVRLGESRDGLPPNPNGWSRVTGADGRTGPVDVPDMEPFLLSAKSSNHKEWRGAPVWRALVDGQTKKLQMQRK